MPFTEKKSISGNLRLLHIGGDPKLEHSVLILCDTSPDDAELKLLENFRKLGRDVTVLLPPEDSIPGSTFNFGEVLHELHSLPGNVFLVSMGGFAPHIIENFSQLNNVCKVVFVNPAFRKDILTKMAGFELPVLVISATPGSLDHDPDAVKYHDLISGSSISYIRGIVGNPIYMKFTQSFNSIQRFLLNG